MEPRWRHCCRHRQMRPRAWYRFLGASSVLLPSLRLRLHQRRSPDPRCVLLRPVLAFGHLHHLGQIKAGQEASITTDSYPDEALTGHIGYIASVAEFTPKTVQTQDLRTSLVYEVRIRVEDPQDRLRLGMPATVQLSRGGAAR